MLSWVNPVVIGLIGILFINCGVLYMMFDSSFDEMCNYEGVINTCDEFPSYMSDEDQAFQLQTKHNEWLQKAYALRNSSEHTKCRAERELQVSYQGAEKQKATEIATNCMQRFRSCAAMLVSTTTTTQTFNCSECQQYCRVTDWTVQDYSYAEAIGYVAHNAFTPRQTVCDGPVCPWAPECGAGMFMDAKCAARGCECNRVTCTTTTTTVTTTNTSTTTTSTSSTTRTSTSTNTTATTVSTTSSNTSTTITASTTNTSSTTTSTTTSTSSSTSNSTLTTTNSSTTTSTTTSTTSTSTFCKCDPQDIVGVAFVGRPWRRFIGDAYQTPAGASTLQEEAKYWQGIYIGADEQKAVGEDTGQTDCFDYFSNRSNYYGPRQDYVTNYQKAMDDHFDLGCGYTGHFTVKCINSPASSHYNDPNQCRWQIDTSTCAPPTYEKALEECYDIPVTTLPPTNPPPVVVDDFLEVEEMPLKLDPAPHVAIPTVKPPTEKCCAPHVASVCRPDVDFNPGDAGLSIQTQQGAWQPNRAITGDEGFFSMVPCRDQFNSTPRPCPQVRIKHWDPAFTAMDATYSTCMRECNADMATAELNSWCEAQLPERLAVENETHMTKVESMEAGQQELEAWTEQNSWIKVKETKQVVDCVDQEALPARYNSLAFPKVRSGFYQMPLHNQCRLHNCKPNQCLEIKKKCRTPYIHEGKEVEMCEKELPATNFECRDKVGISSSNPLSLGFGIAWAILGLIVLCGAIGLAYANKDVPGGGVGAKVYPYSPSD